MEHRGETLPEHSNVYCTLTLFCVTWSSAFWPARGGAFICCYSLLGRGYFFGSSDSGCGGTAFSPLRLFTACRRIYSIWPFTLRSSACAQLSRSSQSAGSIRRRNDFRSAIDYQLAFIVVVAPSRTQARLTVSLIRVHRRRSAVSLGLFQLPDLLMISVISVNQW